MYIHVCTMYRALCTELQILVHVVRIPDVFCHIISSYPSHIHHIDWHITLYHFTYCTYYLVCCAYIMSYSAYCNMQNMTNNIRHGRIWTPSGIPRNCKSWEYTRYIPVIWPSVVYDRNIPGIYLAYEKKGIFQVYTRYIPVIYFFKKKEYTQDIPGIFFPSQQFLVLEYT